MRKLLPVFMLAGCAAVQPLVNPVDAIVGEAVSAARAPAAEQAAALARAQKAGVASPMDRLRLATLLATLPQPHRDDARAAELLEPITDPATPGVGRFAALLAAQIAERQRNVRELDRVTKEAAAAARERDRLDKERDKEMQALRQQLEALRAIERGILEREEAMRRRQK
jgi:hypothetical protein